jgi:hypothetical protein
MDKIVTLQNLNRFHDNILETIQQMIADNNANYHVYCTNEDILCLFDPSIPEEPVEPDTPIEPETPIESIGSITDDNSIVIDETKLENGTYTLRYIDANDNIIDNFNEITSLTFTTVTLSFIFTINESLMLFDVPNLNVAEF